jgi:hypothetical protein
VEVLERISNASGRAANWARVTDRSHEQRVREMYRWVYAREPDTEEVQVALAHIARHESSPQVAYEDLLWALLNTREFLFNN